MLLAGSALGASPPQNLCSLASVPFGGIVIRQRPYPHPPLWKPKPDRRRVVHGVTSAAPLTVVAIMIAAVRKGESDRQLALDDCRARKNYATFLKIIAWRTSSNFHPRGFIIFVNSSRSRFRLPATVC